MDNTTQDFNDSIKQIFHYPKANASKFERYTSSATDKNGAIWSCVSMSDMGDPCIFIKTSNVDGSITRESKVKELHNPSRPFLETINDETGMIWAEYSDSKLWKLSFTMISKNFQDPEVVTVQTNSGSILTPSFCSSNYNCFFVWSQFNSINSKFEIYSSLLINDEWGKPFKISNSSGNCFRPCVIATKEKVYYAWDEGEKANQTIRVLEVDNESGKSYVHTIRREFERLSSPSLAIAHDGTCYIACISIKDVIDSRLGITDHSTGIVFGSLHNHNLIMEENRVADLDEGLLGKNTYVPYFGIRRQCKISCNDSGEILLTWEMRFEEQHEIPEKYDPDSFSDEHYGHLAGKIFRDSKWSQEYLFHSSGTCYSIAAYDKNTLDITYLDQGDVFKLPQLNAHRIDISSVQSLAYDLSGLERWDAKQGVVYNDVRYSANVGSENLSLFWGDTHTHSNFSPDAEGNPDELALYGRDIAGLDFMAMVDNDYYPHAGLSEYNWRTQIDLAKSFTRDGEFVLFPGFEFTYHDNKMSPNFNHRYIFYPKEGILHSRLHPATRNIDDLIRSLSGSDFIMVAHHPDWKLSSESYDRYVEICSSWRVSMEEKNFIKQSLSRGEKFSFIGSSDTHRACPGLGGALTGVYAKNLDPHSLFEGYKNRRTISTQGLRTAIDFRVNDLFIGDEGIADRMPQIKINVTSQESLEYIEIYRNDVITKRYAYPGKSLSDTFEDTGAVSGSCFYYIRVKAIGDPSFNESESRKDEHSGPFTRQGSYPFNFARAKGPFAWSTPIWVNIKNK